MTVTLSRHLAIKRHRALTPARASRARLATAPSATIALKMRALLAWVRHFRRTALVGEGTKVWSTGAHVQRAKKANSRLSQDLRRVKDVHLVSTVQTLFHVSRAYHVKPIRFQVSARPFVFVLLATPDRTAWHAPNVPLALIRHPMALSRALTAPLANTAACRTLLAAARVTLLENAVLVRSTRPQSIQRRHREIAAFAISVSPVSVSRIPQAI